MTNSLFDAKKWNKKILLHLPKNLDELAKKNEINAEKTQYLFCCESVKNTISLCL